MKNSKVYVKAYINFAVSMSSKNENVLKIIKH